MARCKQAKLPSRFTKWLYSPNKRNIPSRWQKRSMSMHYTLYASGAVLILVIRTICLLPQIIYYLPRCTRPHSGFSLQQTLSQRFLFDFLTFYARMRLITNLPKGIEGHTANFVLIEPALDRSFYQGPLANPEIQPTTVCGTWYPAAPPTSKTLGQAASECGGILLHFHGGGYVMGSSRPFDSGQMARILTRHVKPIALFAEYRLSCTPAGRFPAALQDGLSAYLYLLEQGVRPHDIIFSGDSAGGHLVISLLRYIEEFLAPGIAFPCAKGPSFALLWSPWIDVAGAASSSDFKRRRQYRTDYLPAKFVEWAVDAFAPTELVDRDGAYITLLHKPFKTSTKLWIHVGAAECLFDEILEWAQEMQNEGCSAHLRIEEHAFHDIVETSHLNGFEYQSQKAASEAGEFTRRT